MTDHSGHDEREVINDGITNGEVIALVAPAIGHQPQEIEHVVIIYLTKEGHLGGRSTECQWHAQMLCQLAANRVFIPFHIDLDDVFGKGHDH